MGRASEVVAATFSRFPRSLLREHRRASPSPAFSIHGGYVGYLGYELKADCGASETHRSPFPEREPPASGSISRHRPRRKIRCGSSRVVSRIDETEGRHRGVEGLPARPFTVGAGRIHARQPNAKNISAHRAPARPASPPAKVTRSASPINSESRRASRRSPTTKRFASSTPRRIRRFCISTILTWPAPRPSASCESTRRGMSNRVPSKEPFAAEALRKRTPRSAPHSPAAKRTAPRIS